LCVLHRLAETISGFLVIAFGFNDGDSKIRSVTEEIIGSFLFAADRTVASNNDPTIGERPLLIDVIVRPAGSVELREDVFSSSISFREYRHASGMTASRIVTPNHPLSIVAA
jgi:hypothetical protein